MGSCPSGALSWQGQLATPGACPGDPERLHPRSPGTLGGGRPLPSIWAGWLVVGHVSHLGRGPEAGKAPSGSHRPRAGLGPQLPGWEPGAPPWHSREQRPPPAPAALRLGPPGHLGQRAPEALERLLHHGGVLHQEEGAEEPADPQGLQETRPRWRRPLAPPHPRPATPVVTMVITTARGPPPATPSAGCWLPAPGSGSLLCRRPGPPLAQMLGPARFLTPTTTSPQGTARTPTAPQGGGGRSHSGHPPLWRAPRRVPSVCLYSALSCPLGAIPRALLSLPLGTPPPGSGPHLQTHTHTHTPSPLPSCQK